jgi:hypothetical protein
MSTNSLDSRSNNELENFKPSWFDKLIRRIDKLPGPYWVAYLIFGGLLAGVGLGIQQIDVSRSSLGYAPIEQLIIIQFVYMLSLITFLNKHGEKALIDFVPVLKVEQQQVGLLKAHLTSMPARSFNRFSIIFLLVFSVIGVATLAFSNSVPDDLANNLSDFTFTSTPYGVYTFAVFSLLWFVNFTFIFSTVQQLKTIHHAYTQLADINLFSQTELYAFSRVLAARAIGIVLTSPIWLIVDTGILTLSVNIVFSILALTIFFVPLIGVHRLLEDQKDALLKESASNKEAVIQQLFLHLSQGAQSDVSVRGSQIRSVRSRVRSHFRFSSGLFSSTFPAYWKHNEQIFPLLYLPIWAGSDKNSILPRP